MRTLAAKDLRAKITLKRLTSERDEYGEPVDTWIDIKTIYAAMEPLLGNEYFAAEAAQSKVEVKFRTRYAAGIDNTMRIQHGSEVYEILSAINVQGLNRELLLYAKKVV